MPIARAHAKRCLRLPGPAVCAGVLALCLCLPAALRADTAVKTANDATSIAGTGWGNVTRIQADDASYSTYTGTAQNFLVVKSFGFALPVGATIDGVTVVINGQGSVSQTARREFRAALTKDGAAIAGTEKFPLEFLNGTDSDITAGSGADLWGTTWSRAEINSANFGVLIRDDDGTATELRFDYLTVTVTYTPASQVTATPASVAPGSLTQGTTAAFLSLSLVTDQGDAVWTALKVTRTGTLADSGIASVKVFKDNGNGVYGAEDAQIGPNTTFSAGVANIAISTNQVITTSAQLYFVVYHLAALASPGSTIGAQIASQADVTITSPDTISSANFPASSANATVGDAADTVTATPVNQAPGSVAQGADYALERLSLVTNVEDAQWTAVTVTKTGTLADAKITTVKIYLDDGDLGYDAGDTLISPAVTTFSGGSAAITLSAAQTLTTSAKVYFVVYTLASDATVGGTVGAQLTSNASLTVTSPDLVAATNFPVNSTNSSVTDVADTVTVTPTDLAPSSIVQGSDYAVEKLSMATGGDEAVWTAITVTKTGNLADGDVTTVKIYLDTGNGTYGAEDTLVSPGVTTFSGGSAAITLSAAQTITTSAKIYFIVYTLAAAAVPGNTIGAQITSNASLTVTAPDTVSASNFPANSSNSTVLLKADTITVTPTNQAPANVNQDAEYSVLRLSLVTDANTAEWTAVNVSKTGTLADSKITSVKLYLDDGDLGYDGGDTLISPAVTVFSGGAAAITLTAAQTLTTSAKVYFVVYDLAADATPGATIGASLSNNSQLTVTNPDTVAATNFPANSTNSTVDDVADTVAVTPTSVAPGTLAQGSEAALLKLAMATGSDEAVWTAVTVTKNGSLADGSVTTVKVYLDDGDGSYDAGDTLVSPGVTTFSGGSAAITLSAAQTITASAKTYFIVCALDVLAAIGNTLGVQVTSNANMTVSGVDAVSAANFPAASSNLAVVDGQDTVTVTPTDIAPASIAQDSDYGVLRLSMLTNRETAQWTALTVTKTGTAADSAVDSVKVYLDDGDTVYDAGDTLISPAVTTFSGGSAAITLSSPQTLTVSAQVYFVVYDLDPEAVVGHTVGASLGAASALTVTSPDTVSATNFPANSTNSSFTDLADTVTVTPTDVAPTYAIQGLETALLKLSLATPNDSAVWTAITVTKAGTLARADITAVRVYLDDGDGSFDAGDTMLGSGVYPAGGSIAITLSPAQTINASPKIYFIVHLLTSDAAAGNTTGVSVSANTQLTVTAPDTVAATNFPASSSLSTVAGPPAVVTVTPTDTAPASVDQGTDYAALKLSLVTGGNTADWSAITVTKTGTLADGSVTTVKIYLDDGNGTYGVGDTLISPAVTTFSGGSAAITLSAVQTINTVAKVYFIVYTLTSDAAPGATVGARVAAETDLTVTAPDTVAATNFPIQSTNSSVADVADTVTVTPTNQAPGSIAQGSDYAVERLSLAAGGDQATWTAVTVTKTGTLADAKITTVKIYLDDGDLGYDAGDTLVSPAVTTFSGGSAAITLSAAQTITTSAKVYFIVYTLAADATVGGTAGAQLTSNASLTVTTPDLVSAANFPVNSTNSSVTDVADTVTVTPTDLAPANVVQGDEYAVEKLSLATGGDEAVWTALTVTKTGSLPDGDVDTVKVYLDNGNGTWGGEDTLVSPAVTTFSGGSAAITLSAAQTITTTAQVYFVVYAIKISAAFPNTLGLQLTSNAALTLSGVDLVSASNFPVNSTNSNVLERGDTVTVTPTDQAPGTIVQDSDFALLKLSMVTDANSAQWTAVNVSKSGTLADAKITSVKIYLDDGDGSYDAGDTRISPAVTVFSGGAAAITLSSPQTLTVSAQVYFVVYDLASDAPVGATIGASIASKNDMTVTTPDVVSTANFPADSSNATLTDKADTVTVTPTDAAPGTLAQGSEAALLKLALAANEDDAVWTALTVTKNGSLADGSVTTVKIYLDDGDGSYDGGDTLVSPGVTTFSGGSAAITLSAAQTITASAQTYFIVCALDVLAAIGNTLGVQVTNNAALTVSGVDLVSAANFPAASSNLTVVDGQDTVTVTPTNQAPGTTPQDSDFALLRLSMLTNRETAQWTALTVTKTGTAADSAVDSVKVYLDDGDLGYDAGDTLISPAVTPFSGGSAAITLSSPQTLTTSAQVYFVVYDLDPEAAVASTIGASLGSAAALTLSAPDTVSASNLPANSTNSSITDVADTITVTPTNTAPASIGQAETFAPLKLSMATALDSAVWTAITVVKTGNLADAGVTAIRIYLDDGNGSYDAGDTLVSPAANTFTGGSVAITLSAAQTITATPKVYHIVYVLSLTATVGNTIGAQVTSNASLTATAPDTVAATNFPANSTNATVAPANIITVTPTSLAPASIGQGADYPVEKLSLATDADTAQWTAVLVTKSGTLVRTSVTAVRLFLDDGNGVYGPEDTQLASGVFTAANTIALTLAPAQTLTTTAKVYFIVYVLSGAAAIGNTIGANLAAATDLTVAAPDYAATTNFPVTSGLSTVAAPELGVLLSDSALDAGSIDVNSVVVLSTSVTATNVGNMHETYDLKAQLTTGGTPWTLGTTRGFDVLTLHAVANPTEPADGDFGAEDLLETDSKLCTNTVFARGTARCDKRTVGGSTVFWLRVGMPTISTTEADQTIDFTVTVNP